MKRQTLVLMALTAILSWGCTREGDAVVPSFLHIDALQVVPPSQNAVTMDEGFYTADIVAAVVYAHRKDCPTLDTLGHFRLPMTERLPSSCLVQRPVSTRYSSL